jgi:hypothetical protein
MNRDPFDYQGANDGTVSGATLVSGGLFGNRYDFDGTNDYISLGTGFDFPTSAFSISCYFQWDSSGSVQALVTKDNISGAGRAWSFFTLATNKVRFSVFNTSSAEAFVNTTTSVNDGLTHHIVVTRDGATIKIYLDGVLEGTNSSAYTTQRSNSTEVILGGFASSTLWFDGQIRQPLIFDTALTADEVQQLYQQTYIQ